MTVFRAICLEDYALTDGTNVLALKRGQEYTVSARHAEDDTVTVFSRFWARVPASLFGGFLPLAGETGGEG